jgi:hypothetical protein
MKITLFIVQSFESVVDEALHPKYDFSSAKCVVQPSCHGLKLQARGHLQGKVRDRLDMEFARDTTNQHIGVFGLLI